MFDSSCSAKVRGPKNTDRLAIMKDGREFDYIEVGCELR